MVAKSSVFSADKINPVPLLCLCQSQNGGEGTTCPQATVLKHGGNPVLNMELEAILRACSPSPFPQVTWTVQQQIGRTHLFGRVPERFAATVRGVAQPFQAWGCGDAQGSSGCCSDSNTAKHNLQPWLFLHSHPNHYRSHCRYTLNLTVFNPLN